MTETGSWGRLSNEACGRSVKQVLNSVNQVLRLVEQVLNSVNQVLRLVKQVINSVKLVKQRLNCSQTAV